MAVLEHGKGVHGGVFHEDGHVGQGVVDGHDADEVGVELEAETTQTGAVGTVCRGAERV